jgi:hypothetical protein
MKISCWCLLGAAACVAAAGCGQRTLPKDKTYPVRGVVKINGKPVSLGMIEMEPSTPGQGASCRGTIGPGGNFELRTYSNAPEPDGAVPGTYKVSVHGYDPTFSGAAPKGVKPTPIPEKYNDPANNPTVEIKAGENKVTVELK